MSTPLPRSDGRVPHAPGQRAPAGEESAWIREHLNAVLRFAARRLPAADAEDVASESFLALLDAQRRGLAIVSRGAYLLGVARRRVAERLRRGARGLEPVALPAGWAGFCDEPLPDDQAASRELAELVHVALGLLDPAEKALLLARHRDAVPVAELALRHASSDKAIESRLYRARAALRDLLREAGAGWLEHSPAGGPLPAREEGA